MDCFIGVDLGGTLIKAGIVDDSGNVADSTVMPTESGSGTVDSIKNKIESVIEALIKRNPGIKIQGIGIGTPGIALEDGTILAPANIPVLDRYPLGSNISKSLGLPVFTGNDAKNAARGEYLYGAARGVRNFIFVTLGTGIGGCIFTSGRLYTGESGFAGEIGHTVIIPEGRQCGCGNFGCWEAYGSAGALMKNTAALLKKGISSSLSGYRPDELNAEIIFREAKLGDTLANYLLNETCRYIGIGTANIVNMFNPEAVIFGGGMSLAGTALLESVSRHIKSYCCRKAWEVLKIKLSRHGNRSGIIGSAALARMSIQAEKT